MFYLDDKHRILKNNFQREIKKYIENIDFPLIIVNLLCFINKLFRIFI